MPIQFNFKIIADQSYISKSDLANQLDPFSHKVKKNYKKCETGQCFKNLNNNRLKYFEL